MIDQSHSKYLSLIVLMIPRTSMNTYCLSRVVAVYDLRDAGP